MKSKQRIVYLDMIRILACILVVLVHVSAQQMEHLQVQSVDFAVTNVFNILAFSGVSLFVMISGALALNPQKEMNLKELLLQRTLHFFVLYYVWKFFYQIVDMLEKGVAFTAENIKDELILALIKQRGYYHLWYLPMIAILYMAVPVIKKSLAEKKICGYFLTVFFVTTLLFPTLFLYEFKFKYLFVSFFEMNDFYFFGGYLGYFILGHYLHQWRQDISAIKRRITYFLGIGSFLLACILGIGAAREAGAPVYHMQTPFVATNFFTTLALFCAFQAWDNKIEKNGRIAKGITVLANVTLGVYLVHPLVLNVFNIVGFNVSICPPLLSIPLLVCCVVLFSGLISIILLKVPGIRKLI